MRMRVLSFGVMLAGAAGLALATSNIATAMPANDRSWHETDMTVMKIGKPLGAASHRLDVSIALNVAAKSDHVRFVHIALRPTPSLSVVEDTGIGALISANSAEPLTLKTATALGRLFVNDFTERGDMGVVYHQPSVLNDTFAKFDTAGQSKIGTFAKMNLVLPTGRSAPLLC